MNNLVIIKSFPNGISVYMDDKASFNDILEEIGTKFRETSAFFKDAKMAVSFEGRLLTEDQERKIVETIQEYSDINIVCIVGKDEIKNQIYLKALKQVERNDDNHTAEFHKGTIKDHEILEADRTMVIVGDVYPESAVVTSKNLIILGGLYGEAHVGKIFDENATDEPEDHFIIALEMQPETLTIDGISYKNEKSKWSIKPKMQPKIAYVKKGKIVTSNITKELLSELEF